MQSTERRVGAPAGSCGRVEPGSRHSSWTAARLAKPKAVNPPWARATVGGRVRPRTLSRGIPIPRVCARPLMRVSCVKRETDFRRWVSRKDSRTRTHKSGFTYLAKINCPNNLIICHGVLTRAPNAIFIAASNYSPAPLRRCPPVARNSAVAEKKMMAESNNNMTCMVVPIGPIHSHRDPQPVCTPNRTNTAAKQENNKIVTISMGRGARPSANRMASVISTPGSHCAKNRAYAGVNRPDALSATISAPVPSISFETPANAKTPAADA